MTQRMKSASYAHLVSLKLNATFCGSNDKAFDSERTDFWNQLDLAFGAMDYVDSEFLNPRKFFLDASPERCLAYLLGVNHPR
jgi:hypothetical protein